ncbi:MAG: DUF4252 domain-containing protein [Candidatus Methanofastidiosum sp.]|nr:DUF4252 domain-containing protein [Methanofastidiosum sp.]
MNTTKKVLITLLLLISTNLIMGQKSPVDKLFDKYSGKEGYTSVFISKYMFDLFTDVSSDDKELNQVVRGLSSIKILATETEGEGVNFHNEIMKELPAKDYKELMVIKEKDQDLKFLVKDINGRIVELLLIIGGSENALICIQGENINLKNISNLSKSMKIEGLENLDKINSEEK